MGVEALRIENLAVRIAGVSVLRGLSIGLAKGEMVGLLGRNGAGKTTCVRAIMGHLQPDTGSVRLHGEELLSQPAHRRSARGIGYLPEDRGLIAQLTVRENILLPYLSGVPGVDRQRLELVYDFIPELVPMQERKALQLSGGQQKLVALGRAMMTGTRLLLLDEPFEGVAPALSSRLSELISSYRATGCTVLLTQSNVNRADSLFDRVIRIERGAIVNGAVGANGVPA